MKEIVCSLSTINIIINEENYKIIKSQAGKVLILLKGKIFNFNEDELFNMFNASRENFVKKLNGSFLLIIIDNRNIDLEIVYVITDRTNSFKFFYSLKEYIWQLSDNIDEINNFGFDICKKGLACYIANGNMLNGLTLFKNIHMSEGACLYAFRKRNISKVKYWDISFNYKKGYSKNEKKRYKRELEYLLIKSVEQHLNSTGSKLLVSLSAGYDARSILGLINTLKSQKTVETFTYRPQDKIIKNSDAEISENISMKFADNHYGLKSYHGDFISALITNAKEGKCLANFCDEIDAIKELSKTNKNKDVFTGDEWFGRLDVPLNSYRDLLDSVSIVGSWGVSWLQKVLNKSTYDLITSQLNELTDEILVETNKFYDFHDKKDFLYLHQRVNHVNLIWREYFTSQIGFVHNPYLSNEILDFFKEMPPEYRINKNIFIETISELLPDIFQIPIANERRSLSGINYREEILKNKKEIIETITLTNSRLEAFISKNEILKAIQLLEKEDNSIIFIISHKIIKLLNALRRLIKPIDKLLYPILGPRTVKIPSNDKLVLRLLLLWIYLVKKDS